MKMGPIENDVPLPHSGHATGYTATFRDMQPGQSVFTTGIPISDMSSRLSGIARRHGAKYTCRTRVENGVKGVRVWRVS